MLTICVNGCRSFSDQIRTLLQRMEKKNLFVYTEEIDFAHVIISEGDDSGKEYPNCYTRIEVMYSPEGDRMALQCINDMETNSFPLRDLPAVIQSTIMMASLLYERDTAAEQREGLLVKMQEEEKEHQSNLKMTKTVQNEVMKEATNLPGFDTKLVYIPKSEVSGDFVVSEVLFGKVFIFFGDATGHGAYAATYATSLVALAKGYLQNASPMTANLRSFASYMSKAAFFYHGGLEASSAECIFCEIDLKKNTANFCTFGGGTISPLIIKEGGQVEAVYTLENCQCVLPRLGDTLYEDDDAPQPDVVTVGRFREGDGILFYTDGITELFSNSKEEKDFFYTYGPDNLIRAIKDVVMVSGNNPEDVSKAVVSDVTSYGVQGLSTNATLSSVINDDATIYCIRRQRRDENA